jgi:hypothetical protein
VRRGRGGGATRWKETRPAASASAPVVKPRGQLTISDTRAIPRPPSLPSCATTCDARRGSPAAGVRPGGQGVYWDANAPRWAVRGCDGGSGGRDSAMDSSVVSQSARTNCAAARSSWKSGVESLKK